MIVSDVIHDAPVPLARRRQNLQLPFDKMDVGDAVDIAMSEEDDGKFAAFRARVVSVLQRFAKRTGTKFTTRRIGDRVLRCWRIA